MRLLLIFIILTSSCIKQRPLTPLESADRWCKTGYMDNNVRDMLDDFVYSSLVHNRCKEIRDEKTP